MSWSKFIPYGHQSISEEDIAAVAEVLRGDWLTNGPDVEEFERAFASYVGAKHAVSFANGTAALHGAMAAAGVGPGDGVVVPGLTFAATSNSAVYMGGVPVFADISRDTWCLDPEDADRAAREAGRPIRAIAPVSFAGYPVDIDAFRKVAKRHAAVLIEDACHALGASRKGRRVGTEADMTAYSFHPVKHITTCEGGMVTTESDELAAYLRRFRNHGITRDASEFGREHDGPWDNDMIDLGFNYRLSDVACALGRSQLSRLDMFIERRREIAARYRDALAGVEGITLPPDHEGHAYHLFALHVDPNRRREVFEALRAEDIGVQVHYIPVYRHTYYQKHFPQDIDEFYATELISDGEISLPIYHGLTDEAQDHVIETLKRAL